MILFIGASNLLSAQGLVKGFLQWPLKPAPGFSDPGYYKIINNVDHDQSAGIKDYTCAQKTSDGHRGTDIALWPFPWDKMDNNQVQVIAACGGTITERVDGNFDKQCAFKNNVTANSITIKHIDGTKAKYLHLKSGSLTSKKVGDLIAVGEYLGLVGSSGLSSGPHLHFELVDSHDVVIDPFFTNNGCNQTSNSSWWFPNTQKPFIEQRINALMTHGASPSNAWCPADEHVNRKDIFNPGETIYFSAFYPYTPTTATTFKVYAPDGTIWKTWSLPAPSIVPVAPDLTPSYPHLTPAYTLPDAAGTWKFTASFNNVIYSHTFHVKGIETIVQGANLCPGGTVPVLFNVDNINIVANNLFTAQLSNAAGDFSNPTFIGVTNQFYSMIATIPANTKLGNGYRIRVISSNNPTIGNPSKAFSIGIGPNILSGGQTHCGSASYDPTNISGSSVSYGANQYTVEYQWQYSINDVFFFNISGATSQDYNPPLLTKTTYYRRKVSSNGFCGNYSPSIGIIIQPICIAPKSITKKIENDEVAAIDLPSTEQNVILYPNPVSDILKMSKSAKGTTVRIVNSVSKIMYEGESFEQKDISDWPSGIYIASISNGQRITFIKK